MRAEGSTMTTRWEMVMMEGLLALRGVALRWLCVVRMRDRLLRGGVACCCKV